MLAECRRRVRLAVRADQLSRRSNRDAAERAWRRRQAEELGIELSDDEEGGDGDVSLPQDDGPKRAHYPLPSALLSARYRPDTIVPPWSPDSARVPTK